MTTSVSSVDVSSVHIARLFGSRIVCLGERRAFHPAPILGVARPVGERKKSRDHIVFAVPCLLLEPFCRSWSGRDFWRGIIGLPSGAVRYVRSRGTIDAFSKFIVSRSKFVVKAAWKGSRRPRIGTCCCTFERSRTSRTAFGALYLARTVTEDGARRHAFIKDIALTNERDVRNLLKRRSQPGRMLCMPEHE